MVATKSSSQDLASLLGNEAEDLLTYKAKVSKDTLHLPRTDFIERIFVNSDRNSEGIKLFHTIQDVYLADEVTIA